MYPIYGSIGQSESLERLLRSEDILDTASVFTASTIIPSQKTTRPSFETFGGDLKSRLVSNHVIVACKDVKRSKPCPPTDRSTAQDGRFSL